ncbi:hypothetical protein NQ317_018908 [Molorchus minor]|uniref:Uncharacterized protein n=1 Tax=Molorchus minor TaxID=1323400 RepID=A0ABQ9JMG4_9CUCU|nr:hypothetical protein NQ317_018908 [Molorchus minor]
MKTIVGKVVVLGYQGVGKTSTVIRYVENTFTKNIAPTVGASFFTCKINIEGTLVTLQIWDTAGQERFKAMVPMFYRNANAALLLFDITSKTSFESMKGWVTELRGNVDDPMVLVVVGNKVDMAEVRQVSNDEAMQYSRSIDASYLECSAKTDQAVYACLPDSMYYALNCSTKKYLQCDPLQNASPLTHVILGVLNRAFKDDATHCSAGQVLFVKFVTLKTDISVGKRGKNDVGVALIFEKVALGLLKLSGDDDSDTLKVYNNEIMATSSELEPTDTANEETVNLSINSIAHGNSVGWNCC